MMNNNRFTKYFGDFSLEYWIKLLLKGDIILPEFQRPYVWNENDVNSFLNSIYYNQFIPPVIIGNYIDINEDGKRVNSNIILDGQQRLCSLIFAYYNIFPNAEEFKDVEYLTDLNNADDSDDKNIIDESKNDNATNNAVKILKYIQDKFGYKNCKFNDIDEFENIIKNDNNFTGLFDSHSSIINNREEFFTENFISFIYLSLIRKNMMIIVLNLKKSIIQICFIT